ncbi:tetratricopeptide repeat protein [Candidatus Poribacteria bacterium]|nr:tetratricopeptide repeat protein [Candidatus Poribacteria bacterium]
MKPVYILVVVAIAAVIVVWYRLAQPEPIVPDTDSLSMQYNVAKETADLLLERARRDGNYASAIEGYKQALSLRPDNAEAHNDLGATYYEIALARMANPIEEDLREYSPNVRDTIDYMKGKMAEMPSGKFSWTISEPTLRLLDTHLGARSDLLYYSRPDGSAYEVIIICGDTASSLRDAEVEFRRAIDLKPQYAPSYRNLGALYVTRGNRKDALVYFKEALRLEPQDRDLATYIEQLTRL